VLDIAKGKIMQPQFEEGKEMEPHNIAVMEKFKDNDHLIPYISHLDSSKKMYDALTNLFLVKNI
jgi:hypothetical protein